jgi:hypothetical protein
MKSDTKLDSKDVSNTALAPLIEHCNKVVGSKAELAERMSTALGYKVHRQIAEGWVHPDPAKRVEPKLGLGLVLLRIGGEMMGVKKPLHLGRTMTKAFKPAGGRKAKVATNGEAKRQAWADRPRKTKPAPADDLPSGEPGRLDSDIEKPRRSRKADVTKVLPATTQWPAKPKARKA